MTRLSWFVARRYLASRKKGQFLSFITWIALGGITVGVTALIVVLGVMNGMQEELRGKILEATPHVYVFERGASLSLDDWRVVADSIREVPGVTAVAPFALSSVVIVRGEDYAQPADLYGVSLEGNPESAVTTMEADILRGVYALEATDSGRPPVVLGARLAERMGALTGDTLLVFSLENINVDVMGGIRPAVREFEVTGTFETGMYDYDIRNMYAALTDVQGILGMQADDRVSGLGVRTDDPERAADAAVEIQERLGLAYFAESWTTTNQSLFAALELEKLAMGVILFLIVMVAAFNIVSTLVMVVVDRTAEIGILKSMGMTDGQVLRVFVLQGVTIGILGTAIGTGLGLTLSWILDRFQIIQIPPDVYFIDRLPVSIQLSDILLIVAVSIVISLLATIYPALQASRLQPVEAIRHE
ncbi:MAG: ABC transporter permease [Gemmatimonadota bacterium]